MSDTNATNDKPTSLEIEGTTYGSEEILKLKAAAALAEGNEGLVKAGTLMRDALVAAKNGDVTALNEIRDHLAKQYPEKPSTIEDINLDSNATENEKSLAKALNTITKAFNTGLGSQAEYKKELNEIVNQALGTAHTENRASTAVKQIKAELGIDVTAEDIKLAMQTEGISDPVKAVKVNKWDEIMKANKTLPKHVAQA